VQAKPRFLTLFILLIVVLIFGGGPGSAQDDTTVTLTLVNLAPGDTGTVEGHITCAADGCSAFAVSINFDPAIVQVDSADAGPYLGDQVFVADNVIDNEAGVVTLAAVALGDPGETDDDLLFELAITALTPGVSMLRVTDIEIGDLIGNPLPVEAVDSAVVVSTDAAAQASEATPEVTEEPESTGEPEITDPCTVRTDEEQIPIRVGPGYSRGIRGDMPVDVDVPVAGKHEDSYGNLWWKIQPEGYDEREPDRYWVAEEDVEESGDCEHVGEAESSTYVPGQVSTVTPGARGRGFFSNQRLMRQWPVRNLGWRECRDLPRRLWRRV
jgi:hypothetical protein